MSSSGGTSATDRECSTSFKIIAGEHHLIVQLLRDIDSPPARGIVFIWPPAPTVIKPSKLATVTTAISQCTASASGRQTRLGSCPVQRCLEWALLAGIGHGV